MDTRVMLAAGGVGLVVVAGAAFFLVQSGNKSPATVAVSPIVTTAAAAPRPATIRPPGKSGPRRLVLPKPSLPRGQVYSPHTIAAKLAQKHFRIEQLFRRNNAYCVVATGASGNKVQMTIDGASGTILGMAVMKWAKKAHRPAHNAPPPRNFDGDSRPFGAVIPLRAVRHWQSYTAADWRRPSPVTIAADWTYALFTAALPYSFYVDVPTVGYGPIIPPGYEFYTVYDAVGDVYTYEGSGAVWGADDLADRDAAFTDAYSGYDTASAEFASGGTSAEYVEFHEEFTYFESGETNTEDLDGLGADASDSLAVESGDNIDNYDFDAGETGGDDADAGGDDHDADAGGDHDDAGDGDHGGADAGGDDDHGGGDDHDGDSGDNGN